MDTDWNTRNSGYVSEKNIHWNREAVESPFLKKSKNQLALNNLLTEQPAVFSSALKRELERAIFKGLFQTQLVCDSVQSTKQAKMSLVSYM